MSADRAIHHRPVDLVVFTKGSFLCGCVYVKRPQFSSPKNPESRVQRVLSHCILIFLFFFFNFHLENNCSPLRLIFFAFELEAAGHVMFY